jgi:cellobiose transport system permease protein
MEISTGLTQGGALREDGARPLSVSRRRRGSLWHQIRRNAWAYVFISPFYILFAVFGLFPPLYSLFLSFQSWDIITPMQFVGLANYVRVLTNALFWRACLNNVLFILMATLPGLPLALLIAYLIDRYVKRFRDAILAGLFSPTVTSAVAIAVGFTVMFDKRGLVNAALGVIGTKPVLWLTTPWPMRITLAILLIWRWLGWNVVLYLAGLQSIPVELYEAARVDGANGLQIFARITVPLVRPTILYTVIVSGIGMLQLFAEPYLLTGAQHGSGLGGRENALLTMFMYLYHFAFRMFQFGYASAVSYVMFVMILVLSIVNMRLIGRSE